MAVCPVYSLAEAERRRSYSKPLGQPLSDIYMAVDLDRGKERERKRERKREREKDRERERERERLRPFIIHAETHNSTWQREMKGAGLNSKRK